MRRRRKQMRLCDCRSAQIMTIGCAYTRCTPLVGDHLQRIRAASNNADLAWKPGPCTQPCEPALVIPPSEARNWWRAIGSAINGSRRPESGQIMFGGIQTIFFYKTSQHLPLDLQPLPRPNSHLLYFLTTTSSHLRTVHLTCTQLPLRPPTATTNTTMATVAKPSNCCGKGGESCICGMRPSPLPPSLPAAYHQQMNLFLSPQTALLRNVQPELTPSAFTAQKATCSCGAKPALQCSCDKAATENVKPASDASCACGLRSAGACTCDKTGPATAGGNVGNEIDFTTRK